MPDQPSESPVPACEGCALTRRDLLGRAAAAVAMALLAEGIAPRVVAALTGRVSAAPPGRKLGAGVTTFPVPAQDGVQIIKDQELILVRTEGHVYAFALSCPHQNTALRWVDEGRFQCPKHKSKYLPDGTFMSGRATRNMDRYAIKHVGGELQVDLDALYRNDRQPAEWTAAVVVL
jgi:nitrite reductase/ring-hydroxylating ferredoxin subunit